MLRREQKIEIETTNKSLKFCCPEKQRYSSIVNGTRDIKEQFKMQTLQHIVMLMSTVQQ